MRDISPYTLIGKIGVLFRKGALPQRFTRFFRRFGIGSIPRFQLALVLGAVFLFAGTLSGVDYGEEVLGRFALSARAQHQEIYAAKTFETINEPESPTTASHLFLSAIAPLDSTEIEENEEEATIIFEDVDATATLRIAQYTALMALSIPEPSLAPVYKRTEIVTYTVKAGDTPSQIAESHNIALTTLLWANQLSASNYIRPGDELLILPINGLVHTVRSGESVSVIASRYGSTIDKILTYNDIESSAFIVVGQSIIIPDGKQPRVSAPRTYASAYSSLQILTNYFIRPTAGRISQGLHGYNAVDIAGGCWQPIYAAAPGTVEVASGNGRWNGGYGNFVSIAHPNSTGTLYAHLVQVLSWGGQAVNQGQLLGYTGSTGRSSGCHLHWEVRGSQNPLAYY